MGYQITFTPTEEKMNTYKPWNNQKPSASDSPVDAFRYSLISYCMKKREESTTNIIRQIGLLLRCIAGAVESEEKTATYFRWKEDENHELWFCGWEFAHESYHDKDELICNYIERLHVLADIVETPDYFDDHEKFTTKYRDVSEDVDNFIDGVRSIVIHDIINDLDEFKVKDEEGEQE